MSNETVRGVHWSFWWVSVFALLWNAGGAINYLMQTNLEFVSTLPETHRAIIEGRPTWATGGFAIGVFGGVIGCLLLLLRKSVAYYIFIISLLGIIITMIHTINVASSKISFSAGETVVMILLPLIVAVLLILYTKLVMGKNWVN
ncbi:MAG: hypothetical protein WBO73_03330 [Gammaproteobacteria bacterium]|jgi:hypothetical protein